MVPRVSAPAPVIEYFLDSAQEWAELDACSAMTLRLYGDDAAMLPIVEHDRGSGYLQRRAKCLDLADMADTIMARLPEQRRAGLICAGMKHVVHAIWELSETMACWTIEDEIDGGCMLPFRHKLRSKNGIPFKRISRRLRSPKYIRRYVKVNAPEHAEHLMALTAILLRRARETTPQRDPAIMTAWRAQFNHRQKREDKAQHRNVKAERKVIRRSLTIALSVLGRDAISSFLRGEEIRLIGQETILVLKKRGRLADRGHGCLSVALADSHGTRLADLCTFIENTPMLDQLSGFALWMKSGEEARVVETANIIELAEAGKGHPILARRKDVAVNALAELLGPEEAARIQTIMTSPRRPGFVRQLSHEETRERNNAYWEETKGEWMEAMVAFVIGYRNLPIFKAAGAL
jgi:hypothetical protein